ncbi:WXG100 family type VII secretion target, partial [Streptomyces sp. NPDC029006]|uniref:WXG100 family type VII secretion target n=1 Tax=Streptomyces sp. NPDC029006 TaxID=3155467 RepID=UPI0033CDB31B
MPDYNQGGFHDDGTGIYADPTVQGSPSDYDGWDWKQIMAAITGGSALVPGEGGDGRASSVSSPQTLVKAANDFQFVQEVMAMVAKSLADQAKALAGGNGAPWQGGAADAFMDAMTTFSKQVASNAEALGGGSTGSSVAQNLVWSANALSVAQANIHSIDAWYANQAARLGVKPMANGLMPISQKPELVQMMTDDMRAELKKLASNYAQVSQNLGRVQPKPVVSPTKNPDGTGGGSGGKDDTKLPDLHPDTNTGGGSGGPDLSKLGGGSGGGASTPDLSSLNTGGGGGGGTGSPSPFPGGTSLPDLPTTGGGGTGDLGGTGTISPFPGGTSAGSTGAGNGGAASPELNIPDTGTGNTGTPGGSVDPFTGGATMPDLPTGTGGTGTGGGTGTVEPFPGSTGTGSIGVPDPFPGSTGTGSTGVPDPFPGSTGTGSTGLPDPSTGTGTGAGSALPLPGFGSVTTPSAGSPGNSTAGQSLTEPVSAWTGGAQTPQLGTAGTGTALPETGGVGVPEAGTIGTPEIGTVGGTGAAALPSDLVSGAPGLGTPSAMPSSGLVSAPGLPDATASGSTGGAGMPMMPMAPGMGSSGAGGQGSAGAERPDASGLLGGEVRPWAGGAESGGLPEVEPVAGVSAGGAGLSGLGAVEPVAGL